jgi:type I restriction enzyme M protein
MSTTISQQQLESYLWGAAVLLRGTIDAGDYKQFIFPLLFYKRLCDVFDEETEAALAESGGDLDFASYPENHRFQIPRDAHWLSTRQTTNNVGQAIQAAMRAIETANPEQLYGIFGDAQWTNKDRLPDSMLRDLIEHFSAFDLSIANLPEDELGQGYEYLIKKFADDSGHTAAEFYTNRTVVHLMTEMLEPQPGESIYDPTCGSGGMLLSCITHLRRLGQEWRNVRLFGQERNLMTSSIARMNCFLHGIEDFQIVRGDTLSEPKLVEGDRLKQFDLILANPPYSIKQWDRDAFASDPWGRNLYGTPPQGRADYAFWQHILCSLAPKSGRCAILFPHGVLFRQEESEMRRKLIEADLIECVLGLGPNLFYNSPMEACIVIGRTSKPKARKGKILFINAVNEVTRERAQSFLTDEHIEHIVAAYRAFHDEAGFAKVATIADVRSRNHTLSIPLYVENATGNGDAALGSAPIHEALGSWLESRRQVRAALTEVLPKLPPSEEAAYSASAIRCELLRDRAEWTRVRFGDVVENVNQTESAPASAGLQRYIGLDHLEPGSLHVRTWGDVADGTTFTRRCRPGQVLFGKRRAYQRKVAVAEFDAVVSGDIYVLWPHTERLLPELLPFVCLSERFFQHAVGTSAGSLSPRTNWTSLASFEFELPPLDQQARIAEILWTTDAALQAWRFAALQHAQSLYTFASVITSVGLSANGCQSSRKAALPASWVSCRIEELTKDSAYGPRFPGSQYTPDGNVRTIRTTDFDREGGISFDDVPAAKLDEETVRLHQLRTGDFLLSRSGEYAGLTAVFSDPGDGNLYIPAAFLIRYRFNERLDPRFLLALCSSSFGDDFVKPLATGSAQPNIAGSAFGRLRIPVPPVSEQKSVVEVISRLRQAGKDIANHEAASRGLFGALLSGLT